MIDTDLILAHLQVLPMLPILDWLMLFLRSLEPLSSERFDIIIHWTIMIVYDRKRNVMSYIEREANEMEEVD